MPPHARDPALLVDHNETLTEILDKEADTDGLANINDDKEDWTDVKHSERKKRDRLLDDGVLLVLMKKSDYKGFERLFVNLSIMAVTVYAIQHLIAGASLSNLPIEKLAMFIPLYLFYGFQFQCFAFAGQHEFAHRNAFKTKFYNDACLFLVGLFCFELGPHEKIMHKQHHTFTNNIDLDPELTSYYTREQLENSGFSNLPFGRIAYFRQFFDIFSTFKCRVGRIVCSALGIAVDYSGFGWSIKNWSYSKQSGIMRTLQMTAIAQLSMYAAIYLCLGRTREGVESLLFWWIVPVLIGYGPVNYFRNLEHADCEISKEPNFLKNARSVRTNVIIRTLLWDTNYHAEHHCYPMVPFFNLGRLNKLMYPNVEHNEYDYFFMQNWAAIKPGGWIDQQNERVASAKRHDNNNKKKSE